MLGYAQLAAAEERVRELEAREAYLQKRVDRFECREAAYGNFENHIEGLERIIAELNGD